MKPIDSQKLNLAGHCCMPMGMPYCCVLNTSKNYFIM